MFYVIEGFLDVILPVTDLDHQGGSDTKAPSQDSVPSGRTSRRSTLNREGRKPKPQEEGKHLFTVKPGGIAGYLGEDTREVVSGLFADLSSITVQHCLVCGHKGEDGHLCRVPPTSRFGKIVGKTSYCSPDACKEAYVSSLSAW